MGNVLQDYARELKKVNFLETTESPVSRFFHGVCMEIDQDKGRGWSEILRIHNGLYVALADYRLNHQLETCHGNAQPSFHLTIMLSGHAEFQISAQARQTFAAGDLWFVHGPFEKISRTQFPDEKIRGLSIDLPRELIEAWLGTSGCAASSGLEKLAVEFVGQQAIPLARGLQHSSEFMRIARELIYARRQTLADNLRFESLALDLLSRILTLGDSSADSSMERSRKVRGAVDEAVDILRLEWNNPPNISTLARRIGINECYLKEWFRQQMGMTIGGYIRQQRMTKALELIETGRYSILKTALFVGYTNPGHFSTAFKKFYGHLPSYYLSRYGRNS